MAFENVPSVPALWPMGSGLVLTRTATIRNADPEQGPPLLGVVTVRACPDGYSRDSGRPADEAWAAAEKTEQGPIDLMLVWEDPARVREFATLLNNLADGMEADRGR